MGIFDRFTSKEELLKAVESEIQKQSVKKTDSEGVESDVTDEYVITRHLYIDTLFEQEKFCSLPLSLKDEPIPVLGVFCDTKINLINAMENLCIDHTISFPVINDPVISKSDHPQIGGFSI